MAGVSNLIQRAGVAAGFYSNQAGGHMISRLKSDQLIKQVESGVLLLVWNENLQPHWHFEDMTGHP